LDRGKRIPGPRNPWPFGYIMTMKAFRDQCRWYLEARKLSEQYGPVVGLRFFSITLLIVTDPELAKVVLMGSADAFPKSRA
jgi:hypothetical protein